MCRVPFAPSPGTDPRRDIHNARTAGTDRDQGPRASGSDVDNSESSDVRFKVLNTCALRFDRKTRTSGLLADTLRRLIEDIQMV